jgi:hypothetical protein
MARAKLWIDTVEYCGTANVVETKLVSEDVPNVKMHRLWSRNWTTVSQAESRQTE